MHIGSTAVENLCAKNQLDIICIVEHLQESLILEENGFTFKGELNIPLRYYFSKNASDANVNLHAVEPDHSFIKLNLAFRDYLRAHAQTKEQYAMLKMTLLKDPKAHEKKERRFSNYNHAKDTFIKQTLTSAGYEGVHLNFCIHDAEWQEYHKLRKELIFDHTDVIYDPNHPTIRDKSHFHFVLYKGGHIVSVAHLELIDAKTAAIRTLATKKEAQNQGMATHLLTLLEKWLKYKSISTIKLHAYLDAQTFYRNKGYKDMPFDDPCISSCFVNLGKKLAL